MKKPLCIFLSILLTFSLAACSSSRQAPLEETGTSGTWELHNTRVEMGEALPGENPPALDEPFITAERTTDGSALSLTETSAGGNADQPVNLKAVKGPVNEVRAVWISYLDFNTLLKNKSEEQFTQNIDDAFDKIGEMDLNTVYVQVRPFGDALYPSAYFPWSYTITGTEGQDPGFDPLAIMVQAAKDRDLRIEAWINPYRIRTGSGHPLSSDNIASKWLKEGNDAVISYKGGLSYNPGSADARKLIVDGVRELVENYDIDGIHFDDYFYPTTDKAFDANTYAAYRSGGGKLGLADWRRENVNILVREVYSTIKSIDDRVLFGISPQGNNDNNYNAMYIDTKKWLSNPGYVDYICPQIYFGFDNAGCPFAQTVAQWNEMVKRDDIDLYIGLAPYKLGTVDTWAGAGKTEWVGSTDLMERMVEQSRCSDSYQGFALFRYDFVFNPSAANRPQVETEMKNLQSILD